MNKPSCLEECDNKHSSGMLSLNNELKDDKQYQDNVVKVLQTSNNQNEVTRAYSIARDKMPLILRCYLAAKADNASTVALCFNAGVKPMDTYRFSEHDVNNVCTPFWGAICYQNNSVLKLCMEHGASALTVINGIPALTRMFNNERNEALKLIIQHTDDDLLPIFEHPKFEWTERRAQHLAKLMPFLVTRLSVNVINYLMSKNISVHETDDQGFYPIHTAVQYGKVDIAQILLRRNRKITQLRSQGWHTPVMVAAAYGHVSCVELLWYKNDINNVDASSMTALDYALVNGCLNVIEVIVSFIKKEVGPTLEETFFKNKDVLHKVLYNNHFHCCSYLLHEGADVACVDRQGNLPLHIAVFKKQCPLLFLTELIEKTDKKGKINKRNGLRRTSLDIAAVSGLPAVQELLLQKNACSTLELHAK